MRVIRTLGMLAVVAAVAGSCVAMKTLRGSTATYLTKAGSQVTVERPAGMVAGVLQQIFAERGYMLSGRYQVAPNNVVLYFRGGRVAPPYDPSDDPAKSVAIGQIGSWFAARITDDGTRSTVALYGKPTVNGVEVCGDADDQLKDARYACVDVKVKEDWPGSRLVDGREETEIVSAVISTLSERLPIH